MRIAVRSGRGGLNGCKRVRIASVTGGQSPMLWLGAGEYDGLAWVGGRATLLKIRDAITEVLESNGDLPGDGQ